MRVDWPSGGWQLQFGRIFGCKNEGRSNRISWLFYQNFSLGLLYNAHGCFTCMCICVSCMDPVPT